MNYSNNDIDLLYIETNLFTLTLKGKPVHPDIEQLYPNSVDNVEALLDLNPIKCKIEEFKHYTSTGLKGSLANSLKTSPFLYEQQNYLIFIEAKDALNIEFYHENKNIRDSVTKYPGKNNQIMGIINFRNDVGYSELEIRGNGETLLTITIEVFPSKIDYQSDYYALLQKVNQEIYNLSYDFLRSTFQGSKLREASNISLVEFFSIINIIFNSFIKAYRRIEKYPHHRLNQTPKILPAVRVKKINNQSIKWLRKNPQVYNQELKLPSKMLNIDKQISFATFENRFIKWIMQQLLKKLKLFKKRYRTVAYNDVETKVIEIISNMEKKLDYILKNSFLKEIGDLYKIDSLSLVLQMAPGYREVYKYYLMLLKGLSINGQIFKLSMKQIWELYEYWCFLELNHLLSKKYKLLKHNLIDVNYSGIYVKLNKGSSSSIEYENPQTKEKFTLNYNQSEGEKITTGQKPDNVLTLKKEGSEVEYKFIFDAKYRINPAYPDTRYHNRYNGIPGPEEDTINTMHRYRDAIVSEQDSPKRIVVGAFVLFPYHDEEKFKNHKFYQSIKKVNVGAFPFLPDSTSLLASFLEEIIEESYLLNYERNILPDGTSDYRRDTNFQHNVLVGSLGNKKQLEIMLNNNFYYIPYQKSILNHNLEYIAIYQSEKKFKKASGVKYYGKIGSIEIKKRKEISVPTKRNLNKNYIVFSIEEWKELDNLIKAEGYGVIGSHIYTNIMLLEKAKTIPELSIKTLEQWRTWLELKRIQPDIKVLLGNTDKGNSLLEGFQLKNLTVKLEKGKVIITKDNERREFTPKDFIYNLRGVMKGLFEED